MQNELQRKDFATQIAEERKKYRGRWWKGARIGLGAGLAAGLIIGLKL